MGKFIGDVIIWVMGVFVGISLVMAVSSGDIKSGDKANKLVEECQKTLPMNAGCVIVAVPETEIGD